MKVSVIQLECALQAFGQKIGLGSCRCLVDGSTQAHINILSFFQGAQWVMANRGTDILVALSYSFEFHKAATS